MYRPAEKGWIVKSFGEDTQEPIILKRGQGIMTTTITRNNKVVSHKVEIIDLNDMQAKDKQ
jgi:hypothetical protein